MVTFYWHIHVLYVVVKHVVFLDSTFKVHICVSNYYQHNYNDKNGILIIWQCSVKSDGWNLTCIMSYMLTCTCTCTWCYRRCRKKERMKDTWGNGKLINESCLRWDSNPRYSVLQTDALPTELPRQPSWQGRNQTSHTPA